MTLTTIILLIAVIITIGIGVWLSVLWGIQCASHRLVNEFHRRAREAGEEILLGPHSCFYRGSDRQFGTVKGLGIICLTKRQLIFEKLTGQRIEINRSDILQATAEYRFKGKTSFATGGRHLVVETTDTNRIGFFIEERRGVDQRA